MREDIKKRIEAVRQGEVPDGYLRTRAGMMPLDWQSNLAAKDMFCNHTNKRHNGEFQVLSATQDRGIIPRNEVDIDIKYAEENIGSYKKVEAGDFVISLRSFQGGIEYSEYNGLVSPAYTVLKATKPISDNYYRAYFKTPDFISRLNGAVYGIRDGKQIGFEDFGELAVHYPPLAEQQKIAEILATCDRVIGLKQRLLEEKRRQKQWLMQKLLDPNNGVRLPGYSAPWKLCTLGNIMNITSVKRIHQSDWTDDGVRFLRARDIVAAFNDEEPEDYLFISRDKYDEYSAISGKVSVGDLLVTGVGSIGVPYLVRDNNPLYFKDGNVIWFQNQGKIDGDYFFYTFSGSAIQNYIRDSAGIGTVGTYTIESGKKTPIWIPSEEEQKAIANVIKNADQEVMLCKKELEAWQEKKKSLMQLLLTGLVRVNA